MLAGNRFGVDLPWDTISAVLPSLSPVKGASKLRRGKTRTRPFPEHNIDLTTIAYGRWSLVTD